MKLLALMKKEFLRFFRDPRLVVTMLLPGIVIYLLYSVMGSMIWKEEKADYKVLYSGESAAVSFLQASIEATDGEITLTQTADKDEAMALVERGELTAYLEFSERFDEAVNSYEGVPTAYVNIYYNSAASESLAFYQIASSVLNSYQKQFIIAAESCADGGAAAWSMMAGMLPFIIIAFIFSTCMGVTLESIAGEKERGTLATILVTPVRRTSVALGKILPLSCVALLGAVSSFLGVILSFPKLIGMSLSGMLGGFGADSIILLLLLIISIVPVIVSVITVISTYAKSVKEASAYTSIIMILVFILSIAAGFVGSIGEWVVVVPLLNAVVCMQSIFSMSVSVWQSLVAVLLNFAYTGALVFLTAKMLSSEKIMFGK